MTRTIYERRDIDERGKALDADFFGYAHQPWTDDTTPRTDRPVRFRALVYRTMRPDHSPRGRMQDTLRRWFHNTAALVTFDAREALAARQGATA